MHTYIITQFCLINFDIIRPYFNSIKIVELVKSWLLSELGSFMKTLFRYRIVSCCRYRCANVYSSLVLIILFTLYTYLEFISGTHLVHILIHFCLLEH